MRLLSVEELGLLLGRSPETIRKDLGRKPNSVPPRVRLPGVRQLRWREEDVEAWIALHVQGIEGGKA